MFTLTFLGTCATQPFVKRSASAIYFEFQGLKLLLDAGENVTRQILKFKKTPDIDAIFITHLHGDHFYGLFGLIDTLNKNNRERDLFIYGPSSILKIKELIEVMNKKLSFLVYFIPLNKMETVTLGTLTVTAYPMLHSVLNYGYHLVYKKGPTLDKTLIEKAGLKPGTWCKEILVNGQVVIDNTTYPLSTFLKTDTRVIDVFYSGDTFFKADLLPPTCKCIIHQCTYYDEIVKSKKRLHTSYTQIAKYAKAKPQSTIYLTHISEALHAQLGNFSVLPNTNFVYDGYRLFLK